ncbi:MAG: TatD family hydrolase [Deltaproteobacteria bacterium]|nr:TatD family hydrolase [Deltaproteobacteria bacterium]
MALIPFIDPHVHADSRSGEELGRLRAAGCEGVAIVAGAAGGFSCPEGLYDYFRRLDRLDRRKVERSGLRAWVALGVHPAGIPDAGLDALEDGLGEALRAHGAQALGEIGLERCDEREQRLLLRELELAAELGLPAIVHTPREDKARALGLSLEILSRSGLDPERVLLDHLDEQTLELAEGSGCWLGLSVHPAKLDPERAAAIVDGRGPERIVVDSDCGANPSWLFALPAAISAMQDLSVPDAAIRAAVHDHALRFLGELAGET